MLGYSKRLAASLLAWTAIAACHRYEYREICYEPPPTPPSEITWGKADLPPGTIEGRIVSADNGQLLATYMSLLLGERQLTSNDGLFRIDSLPPGEHTLTVRSIGYNRAIQSVTLKEDKGVFVLVSMVADPIMLDGCGLTRVRKTRGSSE